MLTLNKSDKKFVIVFLLLLLFSTYKFLEKDNSSGQADRGQQIAKIVRHEGAMVRSAAHKIILSPPLIISEQELDVIVDALDVAFSELDY